MLGWWQGWWVIDRIEGNGVGACEWRGVGMLHCTALHCAVVRYTVQGSVLCVLLILLEGP